MASMVRSWRSAASSTRTLLALPSATRNERRRSSPGGRETILILSLGGGTHEELLNALPAATIPALRLGVS